MPPEPSPEEGGDAGKELNEGGDEPEGDGKDEGGDEDAAPEEEKAEDTSGDGPPAEEESKEADDSAARDPLADSLGACEGDGECNTKNGQRCASLFANYGTADVTEVGQYCSEVCDGTLEEEGTEYYAECPELSTLVECGYDDACDTENNERCVDMVLRDDGEETAAGFYCYDQAQCGQEIQDVGRTLYVACDTVTNIVSCRNDGACEGEELCSAFTLDTEGGDLDGNYCTLRDACYTTIRDAGRDLYISCPA